jgi:hypothetical protein
VLDAIESSVEEAVCKVDCSIVQQGDDERHEHREPKPSPIRKGELLLDALHLLMEQERWSGENEGENGHAAERNPHADHALAAHRLEHEEAENPVHEIEKADDVVGRGEAQGGLSAARALLQAATSSRLHLRRERSI